MYWLRQLGWLISGIYATIPAFWLLVHPFNRYWRTTGHRMKKLAALWMSLWVVAWAASRPWRDTLLFDHRWTLLLALPFWVGSILMYSTGGASLSFDQLVGRHEVEPGREQMLHTGGIRAHLRHPIYFGHFCTMTGWALATGSLAIWALLLVAIVSGLVMIRFEDAELEQRFGEPYREYRRRVPAVIPKF